MFRFKIALFSVLISGTVLVLFGLFFLSVISTVELKRIDRELLALGESQLHIWHSKEHWENFDRSLRFIYGEKNWKDLIVQVTDANHQALYKSPQWPEKISLESFPAFVKNMATNPGDGHW